MSINSNSTNLTLDTKRHSFAHLMAAAVGQMFPEAQYGVGPVIENGCYYDFVLPRNLIPEDLPLIENRIKDLLKRDLRFKVQELSLEEAIAHFSNAKQPLKVELLENLRDRGTTSMSEEEKADFGGVSIEAKLANLLLESQKTGKELYIDCIILNDQGQVFVQKRSNDRKKFPNCWELVGGGVEENETFEQAARRELKEELNFDLVEIVDCLESFEYVLPESMQKEGDNINHRILPLIVKVKDYSNPVLEAGKAVDFAWVDESNLDITINGENTFTFDTITKALKLSGGSNNNLPTITIYRIVDEKTGEIVFEDLCKGPHVAGVRKVNTQNTDKPEAENNNKAELRNSPLEGWQSQTDEVFNEMTTAEKFKKYQELPYNPKLKEKAAELRKAGNLSEVLFWDQVKNSKLLDLDFERQKIVGNYIVDFYCPELGLVIEIDGESHDFKGEYDVEREKYLESLDLKVIHFADIEIKKAMNQVLESLYGMCKKLKQTPPQPAVATPQEGNHGTAKVQDSNIASNNTDLVLSNTTTKPQESLNLQNMGFKLDKFSASYWRGDQARGINMQRLYALVFETKDELKAFITQREEAKKRDHRVLGQQMGIFAVSDDIGAGLPIYLPNGATIRQLLEKYCYQEAKKAGYQYVYTPHIGKSDLFAKSGHLDHYADGMYAPIDMVNLKGEGALEGGKTEKFYLKPMNCPMHHQVYLNKPRSYRELPYRLYEYGTVYRYEESGALSGLIRVRGFTQNDAHVYCQTNQLKEVIEEAINRFTKAYSDIGISEYKIRFSLPDFVGDPEKYGSEETPEWKESVSAMRTALDDLKVDYYEAIGEAAFYGPKIDIQVKNVNGKEDSLSTIQVDYSIASKFGITYKSDEGKDEVPAIIHMALMGSIDRFMAFMLEMTAGKLPFWLAHEQVRILTINDQVLPFVDKIKAILDETVLMKPLKYNEIRYSVDTRMESLGKKIRDTKLDKIPMFIVVGPKDVEEGIVSIEYQGESVKVKLDELKSWMENIKY